MAQNRVFLLIIIQHSVLQHFSEDRSCRSKSCSGNPPDYMFETVQRDNYNIISGVIIYSEVSLYVLYMVEGNVCVLTAVVDYLLTVHTTYIVHNIPERVENSPTLCPTTQYWIITDGWHIRSLLQWCYHGSQWHHLHIHTHKTTISQ